MQGGDLSKIGQSFYFGIIRRNSSVDELLTKLGGDAQIYGACDPSLGIKGKARDFTAVVTLLQHKQTGHLYVLDTDISKRKPRGDQLWPEDLEAPRVPLTILLFRP